ncbi:MAG TPA: hypothetical protein VFH54_11025 [Mycobacteriales bacterium]|nr:hypothetical protein [Mycobacteriales bacterium]
MRLKIYLPILAALVAAPLTAHAVSVNVPSTPTSAQDRSVDPVVLTGNEFPSWSAGPEIVAQAPGSPANSSTAGQEGNVPVGQSKCYKPGSNPYDPKDNGDHNCDQGSLVPSENNTVADAANGTLNTKIGADVNRIVGYRWDSTQKAFIQFPLQVDEKFTRFISNNASGFAFYSGVDQETNYAFDREGFRYTADKVNDPNNVTTDSCAAEPAPGSPPLNAEGYSAAADPVKGLDDNDEVAFMWRDAGADQAPSGTTLPGGIVSSYQVAVADPSDPSNVRYAYVGLAGSDRDPGDNADSIEQWNMDHAYIHYTRDATADIFQYSQSSFGSYGKAPIGPYCTVNPDGTASLSTAHGKFAQRRPGDGAWVTTGRYAFRYDGRWLMTQLRICPDAPSHGKGNGADNGNGFGYGHTCGLQDGQPVGYGPNIIDQWKARAFQQRPSGSTPCCGYEEEVNNWGGSSILFGEKWGPVRVIRAAWGSDSSTNNIKTEIFYPDTIEFGDNLRVHVIPPFDGIYVMWDYRAGKVATYYNPWQKSGVPIDGHNDEVFGNQNWTVMASAHADGTDPTTWTIHAGADIKDTDNNPVTGQPTDTGPIGNPDSGDCNFGASIPNVAPGSPIPTDESENGICNDIDIVDPTFDGPVGALNWEEIAGPNGGVVDRWMIKRHTGGDAYTLLATPYYRDDSCFDDGTGNDPGPHLKSRSVDSGTGSGFEGDASTYFDPSDPTGGPNHDGYKPRVCWTPKDGDPQDASIGDGRPRKFWNADIGTHGLHINLIADSDNAYQTEPIDEVDSVQRMVVLPPSVVDPAGTMTGTVNVGEQYGRSVEYPLQTVVTPFS